MLEKIALRSASVKSQPAYEKDVQDRILAKFLQKGREV